MKRRTFLKSAFSAVAMIYCPMTLKEPEIEERVSDIIFQIDPKESPLAKMFNMEMKAIADDWGKYTHEWQTDELSQR